MAPACRRAREGSGGRHHDLPGEAVDPVAWRGGEIGKSGLTVQPGRKEGGYDMVARLELRDLGADRLHHPGAIRHRDASIGGRKPSRHHAQIVEVQGGGMHTHADGGRSGFVGVEEVHQL